MKKTLLLIAAIALLSACTDPKSVVISTADSDKEKMQEVMKKLSAENPLGVTVGDAIKQQNAWLEEQKIKEAEAAALKEKLKAERAAAEKQMQDTVTVTLVKKSTRTERGYSGIEMDQHLDIVVGYKNNGEKPIAGVKGRLVIYDIFDKEITAFGISNDQDIEPGKTVTWEGGRSLKYGMKNSEDKQFAYMEDGKYKSKWEPAVIVFKDGSKITSVGD
jgi:hypothetical protein